MLLDIIEFTCGFVGLTQTLACDHCNITTHSYNYKIPLLHKHVFPMYTFIRISEQRKHVQKDIYKWMGKRTYSQADVFANRKYKEYESMLRMKIIAGHIYI